MSAGHPAAILKQPLDPRTKEPPRPPEPARRQFAATREVVDGRDREVQKLSHLRGGHHLIAGQRYASTLVARAGHLGVAVSTPKTMQPRLGQRKDICRTSPRTSWDDFVHLHSTRCKSATFGKGRALGNEHLRTAITRSGLTLEEFADIVGVDVKTVQRWLGRPRSVRGNRARVAGALDTTEHALWPDAVPVPTTTEAQRADDTRDRRRNRGIWARHRPRRPGPSDRSFAQPSSGSRSPSPTSHPSQPSSSYSARAPPTDAQARILIEDPDEQIEPLLGIDAIEIRASPSRENHVIYRADDEMLLVLTRIGSASASPPIIHLRRQADGGLFDRLADDFDDRWLEATPLTSPEQLHAYLADIELEPRLEPERSPAASPQPARAPARPTEAPTTSSAEAPRRWPRRPT